MQANALIRFVSSVIGFMRANAIVKYAMLGVGFIVSLLWGMYCFRYVSLPMVVLYTIIFITMPWHKNRKITYAVLGVYLLTTVMPIDIRASNYAYQVPMPIVKIIPLVLAYPTDKNVWRARAGEIYLGGDLRTGLEPKWVLLWQTDLVSLENNNYIDFFLDIGVLEI